MGALSASRIRWFRRMTALTLAVALVVSLGVPFAGAQDVAASKVLMNEYAPDAYEYDNNMVSAKPIEVNGAPQPRTLSTVDDVDFAKFSASAGSVYVIDATNPEINTTVNLKPGSAEPLQSQEADSMPYPYAGAAVVLELYDANGTMLFSTRELFNRLIPNRASGKAALPTWPDYMSRIVWKAPASGNYYVRVVPFTLLGYEGLGKYNLQVRNVAASITGHVTYADTGKPAPYTFVIAQPWMAADGFPAQITYTDRNGNYILYDLEQGTDYSVWFDPWDDDIHQPEAYNNVHNGEPTKVFLGNADPASGIDAALDLYAPSIQGRLVDENGKPCVGVGVYADNGASLPGAEAQDISGSAMTLSDANGYYYLRNLADGTWRVRFYDGQNDGPVRYVEEWWDDAFVSGDASDITVSGNVAEGTYDAVLTEIPVIASGKVTDKAGNAVPYVPVTLYVEAAGAAVGAQQAFEGYMTYGRAYANSAGYWEYRDDSLLVSVNGGIEMKAAAYPHDYEPYPMYYDQFYKGLTLFETTSWDDAADAANVFVASPGAPAKNIDFALDNVAPFVSGRVTDTLTGAPLPGIQVWAYRPVMGYMFPGWSFSPFQFATTDLNGYYRFQQLWYGDEMMPIKLGFFDPNDLYASEFFDDVQTLPKGAEVMTGYKADVVANAALMYKPGRIYGPDRFATASAIASNRFPNWEGVTNVVVASGDDAASADPLTAASLCWAYDAPMLLTGVRDPNAQSALAAVKAINTKNGGTTKIFVVGGPNSVPEARIAEFAAIVGAANVERLPYGDRYETARQVALRSRQVAQTAGKTLPNFAIIANGADSEKFGDALSASAISGAKGAPILLVTKDGLPSSTAAALTALAPSAVYVAGGPASVDNAVYGAVSATGRMWGPNRYSTSVAIAQTAFDKAWLNVEGIGVAAKVPDALTGGVDMGASNGPLLVVKGTELPGETQAFVVKYKQVINNVLVYGGPASISSKVRQQIDAALAQ